MKIGFCIDIEKEDSSSGKHKFLIRLAKEMKSRGIEITNNNPDVYLCLTGNHSSVKAKLYVLRVDGLIMNTRWNYKEKNKDILKSIKNSDAIIYQSHFCKSAYNKFLKVNKKPDVVIPNGVDPDEFLPRNPKNYFLANSKWRPHKRLKDIIKSFLTALDMGLNSNLIITGEPDCVIKHKNIKYVGWQNKEQLKVLLSGAIASLHLTWLDWCPNSMIEAIVAGCPIIYTKSGGQTELGEKSGFGIEDTQWEFNLIDLYSPPKISREKVARHMIFLEKNKSKIYPIRNEFYIKNVCDKYLDYFNTLLKNKK